MKRLLLDTQLIVWAARDPDRLGAARDLILAADERVISAASTWELAIKSALGRIDLGSPLAGWTERAARELAAVLLPVDHRCAAAVADLPPVHRDPFDRLLVAQAVVEGLTLLTADRALTGYGAAVLVVGG